MRHSSKNQQIYVNQSLKLMQVSYTPSQCVKICQQLNFDTDMQSFKARHNRTRNFENMIMSFHQEQRSETKIECFSSLENRKELTVVMWMVIVIAGKQCSRQWDVTTTSVLVKKLVAA